MKNKILIVVPSFENGGTISTLKSTLPYIDKEQCSIDVFPITNAGANYDEISKYARVIGQRIDNNADIGLSFKDRIHGAAFRVVKACKKMLCRLGYDPSPILFKRIVAKLQKKHYDEVIAFQEGQATRFVKYFSNTRKIAWVHCDYSKISKNVQRIDKKERVYDSFDYIICVSEYTRSQFIKIVDKVENKTVAIHNLISSESIREKSVEIIDDPSFLNFSGFRIVSVGRLAPVKRFSIIPQIASNLKELGLSFHWYIIGGDDQDKKNIEDNIQHNQVSDVVSLLGNKNNPYPYIKTADLLVCTSLSEACPNVINEAKILGTPILTTNFGSASELMTNGVEGMISTVESLKDSLYNFFTDENLKCQIQYNISSYEYDNRPILEKLSQVTLLRFIMK